MNYCVTALVTMMTIASGNTEGSYTSSVCLVLTQIKIFLDPLFLSQYHFFKICFYSDLVPVQNTVLDTVATWNKEWKVSFQVE